MLDLAKMIGLRSLVQKNLKLRIFCKISQMRNFSFGADDSTQIWKGTYE